MYFVNRYSKTLIAEKTGLTRQTISTILDSVVWDGIAEIVIHDSQDRRGELSQRLIAASNLKQIIIVPANYNNSALYLELAEQTSRLLDLILKPDSRIGISRSKMIHYFAENYNGDKQPDCRIVPLMGEFVLQTNKTVTDNIDRILSERMGARYSRLFAPMFSFSLEEYNSYIQSEQISAVTQDWDHLDTAIFDLNDNLSLSGKNPDIYNIFPKQYMELLRDKGAVGNICWRFIDFCGNAIWDPAIPYYPLSISLQQLKSIPQKIVVTSGIDKIPVMNAAISGGLIDYLITDEITGMEMLNSLDRDFSNLSNQIELS